MSSTETITQLKVKDSLDGSRKVSKYFVIVRSRRMGPSLQLVRDEIALRAETTISFLFWFCVLL